MSGVSMPLFRHKHTETFSIHLYNDIDAYLLDGDRGFITKVDALSTRKVPSTCIKPDATARFATAKSKDSLAEL